MTEVGSPKFTLPESLDSMLAALERLYESQGRETLRQLVVNSAYQVDEDVDHAERGRHGHAVKFFVPEALYHRKVFDKRPLEHQICEGLNWLARVPGEFIARVELGIDFEPASGDWRRRSDAFILQGPTLERPSAGDLARMWESDLLRVFLSHKADYQIETKKIKDELRFYGASCFVAHDDIEPFREWQMEIERWLHSAEVMVVLLSVGTKESCWCNQEIGIAMGRGIPIVSVRLGVDPFGFISKNQALGIQGGATDILARTLYASLMTQGPIRTRAEDGFVRAWEKVTSFGQATKMMDVLAVLPAPLRPEAMVRVKTAFASNDQLNGVTGIERRFELFVERMGTLSP